MYQIIYKYIPNGTTKKAFVSAQTEWLAKTYLKGEYVVGAIEIVSVSPVGNGAVLYTDGRF